MSLNYITIQFLLIGWNILTFWDVHELDKEIKNLQKEQKDVKTQQAGDRFRTQNGHLAPKSNTRRNRQDRDTNWRIFTN